MYGDTSKSKLEKKMTKSMKNYIIGIDLGGTKISTCISDSKGNVIHKDKRLTEAYKGVNHIINNIYCSVLDVLHNSGIPIEDVYGVGMGIPGHVNPNTGVAIQSANLKWNNVLIKKIFEEKFGIDVFIDNDVRVATIGEHFFGRAKGVKNYIYITIGTGVACGIMADNNLIYGEDYGAGEFGHITVIKDGPQCACGKRGCLEAIVSAPSIVRRVKERLIPGMKSTIIDLAGGNIDNITSEDVFKASSMRDGLARLIFLETCQYLGQAIANLINTLNPKMFIIGGGVSRAGEEFFSTIRLVADESLLITSNKPCPIVPADFYDEAGLMGAVALVIKKLGLEDGSEDE